ncbi:hypothetical protein CSX04_03592 [Burkholderia cepacia]|nr:hypothetical protein CSX04_03592 [Burkholderia cepacia]
MPVATAALLVTLEAIAAPAIPAPAVAPSLYSELQPDSSAAVAIAASTTRAGMARRGDSKRMFIPECKSCLGERQRVRALMPRHCFAIVIGKLQSFDKSPDGIPRAYARRYCRTGGS